MTSSWVCVDIASNDSTLALARNPIICLRWRKKPEKKNQRMICLPQLVGLALVKEDLGKMNKLWSITYTRIYWWIRVVMGGCLCSILWLHSFCRLKQQHLLFQMFTVPSTFTKVQTCRASMHWAGVGLNITHGLVTCKSIKWEYKCQAVSLTLESGCKRKRL